MRLFYTLENRQVDAPISQVPWVLSTRWLLWAKADAHKRVSFEEVVKVQKILSKSKTQPGYHVQTESSTEWNGLITRLLLKKAIYIALHCFWLAISLSHALPILTPFKHIWTGWRQIRRTWGWSMSTCNAICSSTFPLYTSAGITPSNTTMFFPILEECTSLCYLLVAFLSLRVDLDSGLKLLC